MLKTCTRCRSRRIKCDNNLPACQSCTTAGSSCTFFDDTLGEEIPRSYIKNLYDRLDELKTLETIRANDEDATGNEHEPWHQIIPSRFGRFLLTGPSPPLVIGNATVHHFLRNGRNLASLSASSSVAVEPDEVVKAPIGHAKHGPSQRVLSSLLAHYMRCVEVEYPVLLPTEDEIETVVKDMSDFDRCRVYLASAVAALHKSYTNPRWRTWALICRESAEQLLPTFLCQRSENSVTLLLLLALYELADPVADNLFEILDVVGRTCMELGWHLLENDSITGGPAYPQQGEQVTEVKEESDPNVIGRRRLLRTYMSIARPTSTLFQRSPVAGGTMLSIIAEEDVIWSQSQKISDLLFNNRQEIGRDCCPSAGHTSLAIELLQSLPASNILTHEAWLMLHPAVVGHSTCNACPTSTVIIDGIWHQITLHERLLWAATAVAESAHGVLAVPHVFQPLPLVSARAFMASCVLATALSDRWPGSEDGMHSLLKCAESLAFTSSLWEGGKMFYEVHRQLVRAI